MYQATNFLVGDMLPNKNTDQDSDENNSENAKFIQALIENNGYTESPIHLNITYMKTINLKNLIWFNYNVPPKKMKLSNTGQTVILSAKWERERAYIRGGPFLDNYVFSQIHFHWGPTDMNGSEHYVDGGRMSMELHAVHFKSVYGTQESAMRAKDGVAILVYFFVLQNSPNPCLKDMIEALYSIRMAHTTTRLNPIPLTSIIHPFFVDYFTYWGSLKTDYQVHTILWLICREPIGISTEQIQEFRRILNEENLALLSNCRPVHDNKENKVYYVCPRGSNYATLLHVTRESQSARCATS